MNGCYSVGGSVFFLKDGRGGADDDRSRAIAGDRPIDRGRRRAHLRVLRFRDVHEALRRGVDDVQELVEKGGGGKGQEKDAWVRGALFAGREEYCPFVATRREGRKKKIPRRFGTGWNRAPDEARR